MDAQTQTTLQEILRRESRSVLSYVGDAYPWTTARGDAALTKLRHLVAEERAAVAGLGRLLTRHRLPMVYLGSYPTSFTTINFLALDYLLPRLIAFEGQSIADLERDLTRLSDAEARAEVGRLIEVKRHNLAALEALGSPQPEAVAS
jgi:hypothetical protein